MPTHPSTHHEIITLVAPFKRQGYHPDLQATDRLDFSTLPQTVGFASLIDTAKLRWRIERDYLDLKQEIGIGHYEGRGWRASFMTCIVPSGSLKVHPRGLGGAVGGKGRPGAEARPLPVWMNRPHPLLHLWQKALNE